MDLSFQKPVSSYSIIVIFLITSSITVSKALENPQLTNFSCSDIIDIKSANAVFEVYRLQNPSVSWENVNGPAGKAFRDELMKCQNVCLIPIGPGNADITGIGVSLQSIRSWILLTNNAYSNRSFSQSLSKFP